ncbi:TPA: histidine triad nucleotide-binding protein [Candidatus Spyradomonas excrementavium]|nr:histidine triad nucleotide-binding protein [Candidatus Spyradomonas excrementavium]
MKDKNCIFCKIANGDIPVEPVWENEKVFAFKDANPQAPVHILVVPKDHYASLNELDDKNLMGELINGVKSAAKALGLKEYRTVLNTGESAGQTVFHIHFHVLSGRDFNWPPG